MEVKMDVKMDVEVVLTLEVELEARRRSDQRTNAQIYREKTDDCVGRAVWELALIPQWQ